MESWTISFNNALYLIKFQIKCEWMDSTTSHVWLILWISQQFSCNKLPMFDGFLSTSKTWSIPLQQPPMFWQISQILNLELFFHSPNSSCLMKISHVWTTFQFPHHFPFIKFPTTSHGLMDSSVSHLKFTLHPSN